MASRRSSQPAPGRRLTRAVVRGSSTAIRPTMARRSVPGGGLTAPAGPTGVAVPTMRDMRNTRGASRSASWPTTYQRPRQETTPHGCTVRFAGAAVPDVR